MDRPGRPAGVVASGWGARYRGRTEWAIRGIDLRIEPGERVLVLGRSGSGKSTLLAALAGLLDPETTELEGDLLVDGVPAWAARERAGLLFQDPESQLVMGRAGDDVAFGLENRCVPTAQIPARIDEALSAVDFPYSPERSTEALSGGERQRLALAGVLALCPDLLLLDEPTASLDPESAARVRAAVAGVVERRDVTLVVVDHRAEEWFPLVDRVIVVDGADGVVAERAPIAAIGAGLEARDATAQRRAPTSPRDALVIAEGASFRYPGAARDALPAIDAELSTGEVLAVSGPNGSGKSTLALLLGGLLEPRTGSVHATEALGRGQGGERLARWPAATLVRYVGSVFQDPEHQFLTGSVREEVLLGPRRIGVGAEAAAARADELLAAARLAHLAAANPFTLSGGEKRRLSVATALATRPRVLILDEPTFGQDDGDVADLVDRLRSLRDHGTALCIVTHDERFISSVADRRLTFEAPP